MTIHVIKPEPPVHPDVIEMLTEVCQWAADDKISCLGIAVVHRDGSIGTCFSTSPNMATLIGSVERLKYRLLRACDE